MSSASSRPARARSPEEKLVRRGDILRAAERLWTTTPYAELSMNQVAREVQLAKGTLYLYFKTKEELFLSLLSEHYQAWFTQLTTLLDARQPRGADAVAGVISESLRGFEAMRRLQLLLGSVLEQSELALKFRQNLITMMQAAARSLPYPHETALRVLVHTDALCVGWQHLAEEAPARRALTLHPELQALRVDFETEMNTSLRALLHFLELQEPVAVA